jgi:hypothetical protein
MAGMDRGFEIQSPKGNTIVMREAGLDIKVDYSSLITYVERNSSDALSSADYSLNCQVTTAEPAIASSY